LVLLPEQRVIGHLRDGTTHKYATADHLGSPRAWTDDVGNLTEGGREDFAPFGETLSAGIGIRNSSLGYGPDSIRQKFTGYERDAETGLDFAEARYFGSIQGRFTSPDALLSSGEVDEPQSWNRYSYALNNPLRYTDPFGLYVFDRSVDPEQRRKFNEALQNARNNLAKIEQKYGTNSNEYKNAKRSLDVYGDAGQRNGVTIYAREGSGDARTQVAGVAGRRTADNPNGQNIRISFDAASFDSGLGNSIAHEGSHAADGSEWVSSGFADSKNPTNYQTEVDAYTISSLFIEASGARQATFYLPHYRDRRGTVRYLPETIFLYSSSWSEADKATERRANIDRFLGRPTYAGGKYYLTPNRQGGKAFRRGARF
jgi:RHS repeat-associated protein